MSAVSFHAPTSVLVVGFSSGIFGLYEVPDCTNIHTLRYRVGSARPCCMVRSVCLTARPVSVGSPLRGRCGAHIAAFRSTRSPRVQ